MDQQSHRGGRKNFNGGGGRFPHNNNHYINNNGNNHHHHHTRGGGGREFHSTQQQQQRGNGSMGPDLNNNSVFLNQGCRPTIHMWRSLMRRQSDLTNDRNRNLKDASSRGVELVGRKKAEISVKDGNVATQADNEEMKEKVKGDNISVERGPNAVDEDATSCVTGADGPISKVSESFEKLNVGDNNADRIELNRIQQKEKKLDQDVQRFLQDMERHMIGVERRMAYDSRAIENELLVRDQQILLLHQRILTLEDKVRNSNDELEYYRHMVQQFMHAAALREQDFTAEKEVLIAKAKTEAMSQLVRTGGNTGDGVWQDQFAENHQMNLNNSEYMHHPLFSSASYHAWVSDSTSPCLQPMPTFCGFGIMSDLRDRYEDVKCAGYLQRNEKTEWVMTMIRKIVLHYESHNMRVCEEALQNQYISTLLLCPSDISCPQKASSSLAFGYGTTQLEATENALQQAYTFILEQEKKETEKSGETESMSVSLPKTEAMSSSRTNDTEVGSADMDTLRLDEVAEEIIAATEDHNNSSVPETDKLNSS